MDTTTTTCNVCNVSGVRLIQTFVTDWTDQNNHNGMTSTSLRVCGNCLIGKTVPVFRPQMNRWEFGYVESYYVHNHPQQQQGQDHHSHYHHQSPPDDYHLIQFNDGREYVRVDEYPYASYIACYTNKNKDNSNNAASITTPNNNININNTPSMDHHNHHQGTNLLHSSSSQPHYGGTNAAPTGHDVRKNDETMIMVDEVKTRQSFSNMTLNSAPHSSSPPPPPPPPPPTPETSNVFRRTNNNAIDRSNSSEEFQTWMNDYYKRSFAPLMPPPPPTMASMTTPIATTTPIYPGTSSHSHYTMMVKSIAGGAGAGGETAVPLDKSGERKKSSTRMWTIEEDELLRQTIEASPSPWKWPAIAKSIPGRNGKQCRERYMNHLHPTLKFDRWSFTEDADLFHLVHSCGFKWSLIAKMLPGRTDNSVKNRFHHLVRRVEKECTDLPNTSWTEALNRKLRESPLFRNVRLDDLEIQCLIAQIIRNDVASSRTGNDTNNKKKKIGEYRLSKVGGETCTRCNLMIPSKQTGRFVCKRSGWCYTCKQVSPYLSGDMLRAMHWLEGSEE